jgi:hypothetical protein
MPISEQNENAFKIIEIISAMRVREILVIKSTFLLSLLHLMTPDREGENFKHTIVFKRKLCL